jgi:hypothetical protein
MRLGLHGNDHRRQGQSSGCATGCHLFEKIHDRLPNLCYVSAADRAGGLRRINITILLITSEMSGEGAMTCNDRFGREQGIIRSAQLKFYSPVAVCSAAK